VRADGRSADGTDEWALMAAVARGDGQAFERLLAAHLNPVHHYLTRLAGSAEADDLAQETFLSAWRNAHRFRARRARLTTWLHRIAHNLWIDQLRRRRPALTLEAGAAAGPEQSLERADVSKAVNAALARLPENQRSAVVLCHQQGLDDREAAAVLGISRRALESLLARGRRRLKAELGVHLREETS
jgi:RNA polymerase sigma-70 factor (ECF subfamily)